jgi:hypothetical protein
MSNAFAPIVRARPDPIFGRLGHPGSPPNRLQPDTSSHTLRIPPLGGHPVLRSTPIGGSRSVLLVSGFRLRASKDFSIPSSRFGHRGITPAFGYGAPHPSAGDTLTLPIHALLSAHCGHVRASANGPAFYRRRSGRDGPFQRLGPAPGEIAGPQPNRVVSHAKGFSDARTGPGRRRQQNGARPVRLPARTVKATRWSSLAATGDFPSVPHPFESVPTANRKTRPLVNQPEPAKYLPRSSHARIHGRETRRGSA